MSKQLIRPIDQAIDQRPPGETSSEKPAPLASRLVEICDELLTLGREEGSGSPGAFCVTSRRNPKGRSRPAERDLAAAPAVGMHYPMSGPSGLLGRMGAAFDEKWDALAAEFDRLALEAAKTVKALDPHRGIGDFYTPGPPRPLCDLYPNTDFSMPKSEREWLVEDTRRLHPDWSQDDIENLVARCDLGKVHARQQFSKLQWPGYVVEMAGHRLFYSSPEMVAAFDLRFGALRAWAAAKQAERVIELQEEMKALAAEVESAREEHYVFRYEQGGHWLIQYDGRRVGLFADELGFRYIHALLRRQGKNVPALTLRDDCRRIPGDMPTAPESRAAEGELGHQMGGDGMTDKRTVARVREHQRDLEAEHECCTNPVRAAEISEELSGLKRYLKTVRNRHGRIRPMPGDPHKRAADAVRSAIQKAIGKIKECDRPCGSHFDGNISCGATPKYAPSPEVDWQLS